MIILNTRTVYAGVFCVQIHFLIEHFVEGKTKEEIDWPLVNILNELFKKFEAISEIVDDVVALELTEEEAKTFYFILTQEKYLEILKSNPEAMEGAFYETLTTIKDKIIYQLETKLKLAA